MAFQITPEVDFSSVGLITDVPAHALPQGAWSDCLNMRVKDGSVQGVNDFVAGFSVNSSYSTGEPMAITQWTPAGTTFLNIAYIIKDVASTTGTKGRVFVYNSNTSQNVEITNATAEANFEIDDNFPPQLFVFNGVLICNPGTGNPQYISADATTNGNLVDLPNWSDLTGTQYARVLRPFKNRLVAMSFYDDRNTANLGDDIAHPIDFVFSSHITTLDSLEGVEWTTSFTNTAGSVFLSQTPGRILDGYQLGEFFIAYKTDSVVRVYETNDVFVLGFDTIFEDDGIYSTRCVTTIGNSQHLVIGNYGVYVHDGQSNKQDIAKGLFQDTMFDLVKGTDKEKSFVFQQTRDKEVWFCFRETGTTGSGCNKCFVYNYLDSKVHIRTLPNITDIYETEVEGSLRIFGASPDTNSVLELSSSTQIPNGFFIRTEDDLGARAMFKDIEGMYPQTQGSVNISLFGSSNKLTTAAMTTGFNSTTRSYDPTVSHKIDIRQSGRYLNVRVTMSGVINPKLTSIQFSLKPTSRR